MKSKTKNASKTKRKVQFSESETEPENKDEKALCDDSDNDDICVKGYNKKVCFVCGEFGRDGQIWYRCVYCAHWVHSECSGWDLAENYTFNLCMRLLSQVVSWKKKVLGEICTNNIKKFVLSDNDDEKRELCEINWNRNAAPFRRYNSGARNVKNEFHTQALSGKEESVRRFLGGVRRGKEKEYPYDLRPLQKPNIISPTPLFSNNSQLLNCVRHHIVQYFSYQADTPDSWCWAITNAFSKPTPTNPESRQYTSQVRTRKSKLITPHQPNSSVKTSQMHQYSHTDFEPDENYSENFVRVNPDPATEGCTVNSTLEIHCRTLNEYNLATSIANTHHAMRPSLCSGTNCSTHNPASPLHLQIMTKTGNYRQRQHNHSGKAVK
ncbi:hypothetical protein PR048_017712 [Dryococelus australis]|uniref:Zinc finger PHD-type domain-containing protein n=1 Tax=Dryococelus australis TaxID=614101 RepID=A0ABQ9HAC2_9NEOP|nr:hypothetical protein PR048_017712 [Dryococelus australis]